MDLTDLSRIQSVWYAHCAKLRESQLIGRRSNIWYRKNIGILLPVATMPSACHLAVIWYISELMEAILLEINSRFPFGLKMVRYPNMPATAAGSLRSRSWMLL